MSTLDLEQCRTVIFNTFNTLGDLELVFATLLSDLLEMPRQSANSVPWCVCGNCRAMPTSVKNIYRIQPSRVTSTSPFEFTVLDINVLSIAIVMHIWQVCYVQSMHRFLQSMDCPMQSSN